MPVNVLNQRRIKSGFTSDIIVGSEFFIKVRAQLAKPESKKNKIPHQNLKLKRSDPISRAICGDSMKQE